MKRSTNHILTTHTGSLPRPMDLVHMVLRKEKKQPVDEDVLATRVRSAVAEVVRRQGEVGVTVLNDGEQADSFFNWQRPQSRALTVKFTRQFGSSP